MGAWLRRYDGFVAAVVLAALIALLLLLRDDGVWGRARVIDGDTVEIAGRTIRLAGLDAPEIGQTCRSGADSYPCGERARDALRRMADGADLVCRVEGRDRYGRNLGACEAGGQDVGARLVSAGLAVAYGAYEREEATARARSVGLWAGPFETPADWRRRQAASRAATVAPAAAPLPPVR